MSDDKTWLDKVNEAVDRATRAATEAWEQTAEARSGF